MRYYLGMDVGGTKTHCLIADEQGNVKGFGKAGCGSYEYFGYERAEEENRRAVADALESAGLKLGDISGVGLGVAGADLPEDFEALEERIYTPLFGDIPRAFKNDSFAALRGGIRGASGIVIVCGTGSVCAGRNALGEESRVGGLGPEFGDDCTGSLIGQEGLRAVWRARDGIIEPTLLTQLYVARGGCADVEELFQGVYHGRIETASLEPMATLVFEAAGSGDRASCAILERGGVYLASMVRALARRLEMTGEAFDLVMAGSVFRGASSVLNDALEDGLREECAGVRCVLPIFEPVVGALFMAFDLDDGVPDDVYVVLSAQLTAAESRFGVNLKV